MLKDSQRLKIEDYEFPYWTEALGQVITASTISGTILWALYAVVDAIFINKRVNGTKCYSLHIFKFYLQ